VQGLVNGRSRFHCDNAGVLARAARLAPYFDRHDGRLGYFLILSNFLSKQKQQANWRRHNTIDKRLHKYLDRTAQRQTNPI